MIQNTCCSCQTSMWKKKETRTGWTPPITGFPTQFDVIPRCLVKHDRWLGSIFGSRFVMVIVVSSWWLQTANHEALLSPETLKLSPATSHATFTSSRLLMTTKTGHDSALSTFEGMECCFNNREGILPAIHSFSYHLPFYTANISWHDIQIAICQISCCLSPRW